MESGSKNIRPVGKQNDMSSKKHYLLSALQSFELTINDKKRKYFDKIQSLVVAWDQLTVYISVAWSKSSPIVEVESLLSHTLRIVLRGDWPKASAATQTHLTVTLQRFISVLSNSKRYPYILQQCRVLEEIVKSPWTHPVLGRIFAGEDVDISDLLSYFTYENGRIVVVRLEMMLESKCEDIALRLAKSCLLMYNNTHPVELDFNQDELDYITDIYYCTLFRNQKTGDLINEIKVYDLEDGLQLLKRYNQNGGVGVKFNDNCKGARVWKCSSRVVELVANTLLANSVLHDCLVDSDTILPDLIAEWAIVQKLKEGADVPANSLEMIRKLVISAASSKCIYPFCSFLINHCASRDRYLNLVSTCLIRAITWNINDIEKNRVDRDYDSLKATYEQLSQGFVLVSKLFSDQKNIYRECLLTSFSLTPSREGLQELAAFVEKASDEESSPLANAVNDQNTPSSPASAAENDQNILDTSENVVDDIHNAPSSCSPEKAAEQDVSEAVHDNTDEKTDIEPALPPDETTVAPHDDVDAELSVVENESQIIPPGGNLLSLVTDTKLKSGGALEELVKGSAPDYCTEVEKLKLEESTKTDLNFILRYQRFRTLSWELDWNELKENCENFLEVFEKRGFEDIELKYLDIDYNQFKNKPINEEDYIGIEKGYEHFALPDATYEDSDVVQYSSGFSDEEYTLRPRKKPLRRNKLKRNNAKSKFYYDGESDEEFVNSPGNMYVSRKKRKVSVESSDSDYKGCKKRLKRVKTRSEIETAIDSQSENHPPDSTNEVDDESLCRSNVQLLRQFRIGAKASGGGELSEIACNDALPNYRKPGMKIVISKCGKRAGKEKLVKPRMSVTSPVPGKRSTMQMHAERPRRSSDSFDSDDSLLAYSVQLEVKLQRCDRAVEDVHHDEKMSPPTLLDSELHALLASFDPSQSKEAATVATEIIPKSEPELEPQPQSEAEPVPVSVPVPISSISPLKTESIKEAALVPQTQPIVTKRKYTRTKPKDGEPRKPRGRPRKTANLPQMSSSSTPLLQYGSTTNSYLASSYLQQTPYTPTSYSADSGVASAPTANCVNDFSNNVPNDWGVSWDQNYTQLFASALPTPATTSCNYVEPGSNSYVGTAPATGHTQNEVAGPPNSAVFSNADEMSFFPNYTGGFSTANVEHTPSSFANYDAVASSSSSAVNAQQTTSPMYTNYNTMSSSTPNYVQSSLAINGVSVQPPAEFAGPKSGIEPVQTICGTYGELVHRFTEAQPTPAPVQPPYDGMKRQRKKKNLEFPGPASSTSCLANGQLTGETKKRPRKPKNDDGQPAKVPRSRKPKAEPHRDFAAASSMPAMNDPASSPSSSFNYGVSPAFVQNTTFACQQTVNEQEVQMVEPPKPKNISPTNGQRGPVGFSSTSDYLPLPPSALNANYATPSAYSVENSFLPSTVQSNYQPQNVTDSNGAASHDHFTAGTSFQSPAGVSFVPQGPVTEKIKVKRPRKPKPPSNMQLSAPAEQRQTDECGQENTLLDRLAAAFTIPTSFSNDRVSSMLTSGDSDQQLKSVYSRPVTVVLEKIPTPPKTPMKPNVTPSGVVPPKRRGRPPKQKPVLVKLEQESSTSVSPPKPTVKSSYLWSSVNPSIVRSTLAIDAPKDEAQLEIQQETNASRLPGLEAEQRSIMKKCEAGMANAAPRTDAQYTDKSAQTNYQLSPTLAEVAHQSSPVTVEANHSSPSQPAIQPDRQLTEISPSRTARAGSDVLATTGAKPRVGAHAVVGGRDALNPVVLITPMKLPPSSTVKLPDGPNSKVVPNNNTQHSLPSVQVRLPSLSNHHLRQCETEQADESFNDHSSTSTSSISTTSRQCVTRAPSLDDFLSELNVEQLTPANLSSPVSAKQQSPAETNLKTYFSADDIGDNISSTLINATTPKTLSEGYMVLSVPDMNVVSDEQLSPNADQITQQHQYAFDHMLQEGEHQYSRVYHQFGRGEGDASDVSAASPQQSSSSSSHNYSGVAVNVSSVSNIEEEYEVEVVSGGDSETPCISIPENALSMAAFSESYLTMSPYLSLMRNTNPNPPRDQTVSSNNDYIDLFNPYLLDQMTSYGQ